MEPPATTSAALDFERRRLTEADWRELREWVRSQVTDTNCGRCKATIPAGDEEFCWYCQGFLCYECWDEYGHCGHARADEINAEGMARAREALSESQNT